MISNTGAAEDILIVITTLCAFVILFYAFTTLFVERRRRVPTFVIERYYLSNHSSEQFETFLNVINYEAGSFNIKSITIDREEPWEISIRNFDNAQWDKRISSVDQVFKSGTSLLPLALRPDPEIKKVVSYFPQAMSMQVTYRWRDKLSGARTAPVIILESGSVNQHFS